ncbi:hypothetical protein HAX54_007571 [Datura stramonium]|uniref:Uncharacterized protein n=1 Tax=Datura stramonium TaxID=4076 RepID=A0ABS8TC12_DATST|nr:hypothetical protein [Datura stramonium]
MNIENGVPIVGRAHMAPRRPSNTRPGARHRNKHRTAWRDVKERHRSDRRVAQMAQKVNKGKGVASSSHGSKRARITSEEEHEDLRMAPPPLRRYGLYWVMEQEDRILTLGLGFVFDALNDCNLNMVREFPPNWMPKERSNQIKIRGQIIDLPVALNILLRTPHVDPQPFVNIVKKPSYKDIRHFLCVPNSVSRWTRHQQFGYHVSLPHAHLSRGARV